MSREALAARQVEFLRALADPAGAVEGVPPERLAALREVLQRKNERHRAAHPRSTRAHRWGAALRRLLDFAGSVTSTPQRRTTFRNRW